MNLLGFCTCVLLAMSYQAFATALAQPLEKDARSEGVEQSPSTRNQRAPAKAYLIEATSEVNGSLARRIHRELETATVTGASVVIVEIDTFGGRLDAAVQIRDALLRTDLHTIAFVNKRAISAGALISLATHDIVMTSGATIGAATPVRFTSDGPKPLGEKTTSYFRKEMKATAESRNHPTALAEAMVDPDVIVPGVIEKGKLLTLTTQEALKLKLAAAQRENLGELLKTYKLELVGRGQSAWDLRNWFKPFRAWHIWLILGVVLTIVEITVSGFFLLWFAVGAYFSSLLAWWGTPLSVQITCFLASSFLLLVFSRTVLRSVLFRSRSDVVTNVDALKGRSGVVLNSMGGSNEPGIVKIGGEEWSAVSADGHQITEGSKVEVLEVIGNKVKVKLL